MKELSKIMSKAELSKAYEPNKFESDIYKRWEASGYFNPDNLPGRRAKKFSIAMPPPNATGTLHVGHAVTMAIEDIMTRYARMRGDKALWLPGTDHAAIATQNVVEKQLKAQGKTKHDLGREAFVAEVETFVEKSKSRIREQIRAMGSSCDWSRERYTMDAGMTAAVQEMFVRMHADGLIYRGERVVNWCPRCQSTLANDEVEYETHPTTLYTFRYDKAFPIPISTTRPETKFGDTGVAVHPSDERYKKFIGKTFTVNFEGVERTIKIVADRGVDPKFGSGALGVTPAHSLVDEAIAKREKLPSIKVIDENATMTEATGVYKGLSAIEARERLAVELKKAGLITHEENIEHNLSVCYRCGTALEPLPSKQWFIAVDTPALKYKGKKISLKNRAVAAVRSGEIEIIPRRFKKTYFNWMENLHDWNISRQLWFGHRLPVWYQGEQIVVAAKKPAGNGWQQDPDVLDTWFSSGLWTFATLGWPKKSKDLSTFHPTTVMETGYDILFFWVARMVLMTTYAMEEIPFKTVYLHGLVRDKQGRKMSKSLGNGIDPLEMSEKYSADAVRLSLVAGTTPGNDMRLYEEKIASYRNFGNKIWNIARYAMMNFDIAKTQKLTTKGLTIEEKAILHQLNELVKSVTAAMEEYNYGTTAESIYNFIWHQFADIYLEETKARKIKNTPTVIAHVLKTSLQLLHPFMPFVTEHIWQTLGEQELLMVAPWPKPARWDFEESYHEHQMLVRLVEKIRLRRSIEKIPATQSVTLSLSAKKSKNLITDLQPIIQRLVRAENVTIAKTITPVLGFVGDIHFGGFGSSDGATALDAKREELRAYIMRLEQKLLNNAFRSNAPAAIVQQEEEKLAKAKEELKELNSLY